MNSEEDEITFAHMIPKDVINKIRSVTIYRYYNDRITGFSFFDKDGKRRLWKIGDTDRWMKKEKVVLEENEIIVGVKASNDKYSRINNF